MLKFPLFSLLPTILCLRLIHNHKIHYSKTGILNTYFELGMALCWYDTDNVEILYQIPDFDGRDECLRIKAFQNLQIGI